MTRTLVRSAALFGVLGALYAGCTNDFEQFTTPGTDAATSGTTSSATSTSTTASGGQGGAGGGSGAGGQGVHEPFATGPLALTIYERL